jgi:hypothetical protein|tara:strand:+ start:395 stop:616 length:222 start_codon:yes stop_codon:yes gene_type:complete
LLVEVLVVAHTMVLVVVQEDFALVFLVSCLLLRTLKLWYPLDHQMRLQSLLVVEVLVYIKMRESMEQTHLLDH